MPELYVSCGRVSSKIDGDDLLQFADGTRLPRSHYSFSQYTNFLGLSRDGSELIGEEILDVGSGNSNFARICQDRKIAKVFPTDISYSFSSSDNKTRLDVAGDINYLPYAANMFDRVIAIYLLYHLRDVKRPLWEMIQTTKGGGVVEIFPVRPKSEPLTSCDEVSINDYTHDGRMTLKITKVEDRSETQWKSLIDQIDCNFYFNNRMNIAINEMRKKGILPRHRIELRLKILRERLELTRL